VGSEIMLAAPFVDEIVCIDMMAMTTWTGMGDGGDEGRGRNGGKMWKGVWDVGGEVGKSIFHKCPGYMSGLFLGQRL
jgi:hypothetical protein